MQIQDHVTSALTGAPKRHYPFPYFYAKNVFPEPFYAKLISYLSQKQDYHATEFSNRAFADSLDDFPELSFFADEEFFFAMLHIFKVQLTQRFKGLKIGFYRDVRLIRDRQHYKIGPHTDAEWKVLSLLFYLPPTDEFAEYGTSIYVPHDRNFVCEGGPHHKFDDFEKLWTAPFMPNTCLGFWKTNKSFHGVEPIPVQFQRDVLLYNIYCADENRPPAGAM